MSKNIFKCYTTLFIIFISSLVDLNAQTGDYLLTHHKLEIGGIDNLNFEIKVNNDGFICIANRSGILLYDGQNWDYISTPSAAISMDYDNAGNIYVGCVGDYGKIDFQDYKYQFVSLKDSIKRQGLFIRTLYLSDSVFFMNEKTLEVHALSNDYTTSLKLQDEDEYFTNIFNISDSLIVQSSDAFYLLKQDSLYLTTLELPDFSDILFFKKHPGENKYLVGTASNAIYIYEEGIFSSTKISSFLTESSFHIIDGEWINSSQYALSTLENGCLIIDFHKDRIHDSITSKKGLPDDEIYAISSDNEEGLWISHEFGLSRMESNIPVKSYSNYSGLEGNLTAVYEHDTSLFVAGSRGVLYLGTEHEYKKTVYYTLKKNPAPPKKEQQVVTKENQKTNPVVETKKRKRINLKGLFKKKRKQNKSNKQIVKDPSVKKKQGLLGRIVSKLSNNKKEIKKITGKPSARNQYVRHVRNDIVGTKFLYKPVKGLDTKMEFFVEFKNKLLTAGNAGVYEVTKNGAELVIDVAVRNIIVEGGGSRLLVYTYENEILIYELIDDIWIESDYLTFYGEIILSLFSEENGNTWLASADKLYFFDSLYSANDNFKTYSIQNQFIDNIRLTRWDDKLYLINSLGYYFFDEAQQRVISDDSLAKAIGKPVKHLIDPANEVWIFNGKNWISVSKNKEIKEIDHLGIFRNMSFISRSKNKFWLINDFDDLYMYDPSGTDSLLSTNQMFIRKVNNKNGRVDFRNNLVFNHDENSIQFELSRPDYLGLLKVEYQFQLRGLSDKWSDWSNNKKIDFNFLPPNKYTLTVRSRDAFGNIQESSQVQFTIKPPYWQTLWFYGLQIFFVGLLVFLSARLNRTSNKKYVIVTEALTILTIVMIIEFLQTVAGNYLGIQSTPVVDFLIDVGIALLVFPLEQILKKVMRAEELPGNQGKGLLDFIFPKKTTA